MHLRGDFVQGINSALDSIQFRRSRLNKQQTKSIIESNASARRGQIHTNGHEEIARGCANGLHVTRRCQKCNATSAKRATAAGTTAATNNTASPSAAAATTATAVAATADAATGNIHNRD